MSIAHQSWGAELASAYRAAPLGVAHPPLIRYPLNRERRAEIRDQLARLEAQGA